MPPAVPGFLNLRTAAQRAGKRLKGVDLRFGLPTGAPEGRAGGSEGTTLALRALWATAVVLLLATAVQAVVTHRTLYQDGGHYLVVLLQTERATDWFWARHFAQVLTQWPLVMALRAGLEDLPACMTIQAVGLFYLTPLAAVRPDRPGAAAQAGRPRRRLLCLPCGLAAEPADRGPRRRRPAARMRGRSVPARSRCGWRRGGRWRPTPRWWTTAPKDPVLIPALPVE